MPLRLMLSLLALLVLGTASAEAAKPKPDLVVTSVSVAGSKVAVTTKNTGKGRSAKTITSVWLRKKGGVLLGRQTIAGLPAGKSSARAIPVAPGTHVVVGCADAGGKVKERNEKNNCKTATVVVRAASAAAPGPAVQAPSAPGAAPAPAAQPSGDGANLTVTDVSDPPATGREGEQFGVDDTAVNGGTAPAQTSAVRFYLSPDSEQSLNDRRESLDDPRTALRDVRMGGAREIQALGPQARSDGEDTQVTIPVGISAGVYYLLACADDRGAVAEVQEDDNCRVATHTEDGVEKPTPVQILAGQQQYRIDAFSDVLNQPDLADDEADLAQLSQVFCKNPIPGTVYSLPAAIASIKAFLDQRADQSQFRASPEFQDAFKAETAAGAAILANRPGAALAAMIRAHELQPAQASHLINAAAVASSVGLPSEALALLDAAEQLDDPDRPAMGIPRHAVALANRGQALALLGRHAEADRSLAQALTAEPLLSEANTSRSATAACTQGPKPAALYLRAGRLRQPPAPIDTSRGRETELRDLQLPGFPKQAAEMRTFFAGQSQKLLAETTDQINRQTAREAKITAKRATWTKAQDRRYAAMLGRIYDVSDEPDIHALDVKFDQLLDKVIKTQRDFWGDNEREDYEYALLSDAASKWCEGSPIPNCFAFRMNETCRPKLKLAHQAWLDQMQEAYGAAQVLQRASSKRMSAYAANLADEDANALALIQVEQYERALYGSLLQWAQHWTHSAELFSDHCVEPLDPPTNETAPGPPDVQSDGACGGLLKAMSGVFELGPTKLKISCESIQQSFKQEVIPWLQAYAEVTYDIRHGRLTVFGGTKAEVSAGVAKGAFKSGIYVSADRDGVMDAGWRVGPSATVGAGPVQFGVYKDEIDMSFVGAVSATLGL